VEIREGKGFNRGICIGLLLPPRCQPNRTKGKSVLKISWTPEKIFADPLFPPLVGLAREKGEREMHGKSRVVWLRFEFKFES
jgi:hypothetical protein